MMHFGLVMLAAGASERYGTDNKLLAHWKGRPLIDWSLSAASNQFITRKLLISQDVDTLTPITKRHDFEHVINKIAHEGMGTSIALGASHMDDVDGMFIALADMPRVQSDVYEALANAFVSQKDHVIRPAHDGWTGHPVLFPKHMIPALASLTGDVGAKDILAGGDCLVHTVEWPNADILIDVDTQEDLARL
jgi:CTP:molybdopterin cytidylyltransferase MocA